MDTTFHTTPRTRQNTRKRLAGHLILWRAILRRRLGIFAGWV